MDINSQQEDINLKMLYQSFKVAKYAGGQDRKIDYTTDAGKAVLRMAMDLVKSADNALDGQGVDHIQGAVTPVDDSEVIAVIAVNMAEFETTEVMVAYEETDIGKFHACWMGYGENSSPRMKQLVKEFVNSKLQ